MKRITSLLLAVALTVSGLFFAVPEASASTEYFASDACIELMKKEEGFVQFPMWDYQQYSIGYGTRCPDDMLEYYIEYGITEEEAETLFRNQLAAFEKQVNERIVQKYSLQLTQNQFDALVSFSYNCGTTWTTETTGTFFNAIVNGAVGNDLIRAFALWCSAGGEVKTFLLRRRLSEANMYLNGVYDQSIPAHYCYVLYNANGGTTNPRTQGYSTQWPVAPYPVPVREGYTFDGWYTDQVGGTKVTALDASHNGTYLYAHWLDANGQPPEQNQGPVTVTVTGTDVNLRSGPGTNYTTVGKAQKGDTFVITATADGDGYHWGQYEGGWICLQYTDYETVIQQQPTIPPETTVPTETTEPPETTAPPASLKITGTVNVNEFLRIRQGPGTGYPEVGRLNPNDRVEILDTKLVGATLWGQIAQGWVSMDYIILDENTGVRNGWAQENGIWYYYVEYSRQKGWLYSGAWYYLDSNGAMVTGWVYDGAWYYMNTSGAMVTGWVYDRNWYYMNTSGAMVTGWVYDGAWYYMDDSGAMVTGWVYDRNWYYMNTSGAMATGWVYDGAWYYMDSRGAMFAGWLYEGGRWYYLDASGAMVANTTMTIGGVEYTFNSSGVWIG